MYFWTFISWREFTAPIKIIFLFQDWYGENWWKWRRHFLKKTTRVEIIIRELKQRRFWATQRVLWFVINWNLPRYVEKTYYVWKCKNFIILALNAWLPRSTMKITAIQLLGSFWWQNSHAQLFQRCGILTATCSPIFKANGEYLFEDHTMNGRQNTSMKLVRKKFRYRFPPTLGVLR